MILEISFEENSNFVNVEFEENEQILSAEFKDMVIVESGEGGGNAASPVYLMVEEIPEGAVITAEDSSGITRATVYNGKDGYTPVKGVDYFDGKDGVDGADGKDGYTPIKGVDYFDGEPGVNGNPGADGADGITPHIGENGNWWIGDTDTGNPSRGESGKDGSDGQDGYTPVKNEDYFDGKDGISPIIAVEDIEGGHKVTITDAEGEETFEVLNGKPGETGQPGADGHTPVKGEDYWTDEDKQEIIREIEVPDVNSDVNKLFSTATQIGTYTRVDSSATENFTITLTEDMNNFVFIYFAVASGIYYLGSSFVPVAFFKLGKCFELNCINDQQSLFVGNAQYVSDMSVKGKVGGKTPNFEVWGIGRIKG